jgi:hypothetical protein
MQTVDEVSPTPVSGEVLRRIGHPQRELVEVVHRHHRREVNRICARQGSKSLAEADERLRG